MPKVVPPQSVEVCLSPRPLDASAWVEACANNVTMATQAAELVYGCFRTIAAQQTALAARVMTLATHGTAGRGAMPHPAEATKLSYQSCDLVIGGPIEALETVRQASSEVQRLMLRDGIAADRPARPDSGS